MFFVPTALSTLSSADIRKYRDKLVVFTYELLLNILSIFFDVSTGGLTEKDSFCTTRFKTFYYFVIANSFTIVLFVLWTLALFVYGGRVAFYPLTLLHFKGGKSYYEFTVLAYTSECIELKPEGEEALVSMRAYLPSAFENPKKQYVPVGAAIFSLTSNDEELVSQVPAQYIEILSLPVPKGQNLTLCMGIIGGEDFRTAPPSTDQHLSAGGTPEVWVYASTPQCVSRASSEAEPESTEPVESIVVPEPEVVEPDSGFNSSTNTAKEASTEPPMPPTTDMAVLPPSGANARALRTSSGSSPPASAGFQRQKSVSSDAGRRSRQRRLQMPLMYRLYESQSEDVRGTIRGPDDETFRPEEASKQLRNALSGGIQADDKIVMQVLLSHTNYQRQKIVAAYEGMYNRKLADDIEEEAGGYFLDATLALLQPAHVYSARILHNSLSIRSVNRSIAVEIALCSSASQLKVIRDAYKTEYNISLEKDLGVKVEGLFGKMLQSILMRKNDPTDEVDIELADSMIAELTKHDHGVEELGRNPELFQKVFSSQGLNQIRCFLDRFDARATSTHHSTETISDTPKPKDFESILRKSANIHSEVRHLLLMYSKIARNMQLYFAERIHEAVSGSRPDHSAIIRILVTRSEIDLHDICDEYKRRYGRNVTFELQQTCSGDFLRLLNLLVNPQESDDVFTNE